MAKQSRLRVQKAKNTRRIILYAVLGLVVCIIFWRVEKRIGLVDQVQKILISIEETFTENIPVRGAIYDRNLKQIAVTMERVSVYARTREIDSIPETVKKLGLIFPLDEVRLQENLESGILRVWVAQDISQEQEVIVKNQKIPGVYLQHGEKRFYPNGFQAAHLIGYVTDSIGLSGVEYYYDRLLASRKVEQQKEDQPLSMAQDLVLTIDLKIQTILEKLVRDIHIQEKALRVAAYALESGTGELVGGAQMPTFDPNAFTSYSKDVLDNLFLNPVVLPNKFRFFLRDAAMIKANGESGIRPSSWSLLPPNNSLGGQLQLWELLGLNESLTTDFYPVDQIRQTMEKRATSAHSELQQLFGVSPEIVTPLNLLTAFSALLNGEKKQPFAVQKIIDIETEMEVFLTRDDGSNLAKRRLPATTTDGITQLFRSQSIKGEGKTFFFRDSVPVFKDPDQQLIINDMMVVSIPAGGADLVMLVMVERTPRRPENKKSEDRRRSLELIVGEKVERISVLQQVAKSVADVVEPEFLGEGNYQLEQGVNASMTDTRGKRPKAAPALSIMPDLGGLSLRKSLRLLQGIKIKINIQGTGRVVSQKPHPGAPLRGIKECFLVLEKDENMKLEKLSKELLKKQ